VDEPGQVKETAVRRDPPPRAAFGPAGVGRPQTTKPAVPEAPPAGARWRAIVSAASFTQASRRGGGKETGAKITIQIERVVSSTEVRAESDVGLPKGPCSSEDEAASQMDLLFPDPRIGLSLGTEAHDHLPAQPRGVVEAERQEKAQRAKSTDIHGVRDAREALSLEHAPQQSLRGGPRARGVHAEEAVQLTGAAQIFDLAGFAACVIRGQLRGQSVHLSQEPRSRRCHLHGFRADQPEPQPGTHVLAEDGHDG